jgi:hypothetical protein
MQLHWVKTTRRYTEETRRFTEIKEIIFDKFLLYQNTLLPLLLSV